jgi:hypothetical protein
MHSRRLVCLLLGIWIGGAALAAWAAAVAARSPERLIKEPAAPAARVELKNLGQGAARAFRYQAAEQNRVLAEDWGRAQLMIGTALFLFLLFGTAERKGLLALALAMLILTAIQRFLLAPEMDALGRVMDYGQPGIDAGGRSKLGAFSTAYRILEALKWTAGGLLALDLARRHGSRSHEDGHRPAAG